MMTMTIRNKLYLGFGLILAFILGQAVITYLLLNQSETLVRQTIDKDFNASVEIARIAVEAQKLRRFEKEYLIYVGIPGQRDKYFSEWKGAHDQIKLMLNRIIQSRDTTWSSDDVTKAKEWLASLGAYENGFTRMVQQADSGTITTTLQGNEAVREAKDAFRVLLDGTAQGGDLKLQSATKSGQTIFSKFGTVNLVLVISALAGIGLVVVLLVVVPASISGPIEALTRSAHDMSIGNVSKPVTVTGGAEFKDLSETLERMRISQQMLLERMKNK